MYFQNSTKGSAVAFATIALSTLTISPEAHAAGDPRGIWYDHNGRGAVEIKECAGNAKRLCGHVVYVKKARNKKRCGMQIIGNVRSNGRGWIYSPKRGRSYPLAVKRLSNNRLRIIGNAGSFFTKKYIWKRAPDTIANCNQPVVAKKTPEAQPQPTKVVTKTPVKKVAKVNATPKAEPKVMSDETRVDPGNASSATAALLARPRVQPVAAPEPAPVETAATAKSAPVDDLTPPGGISKGGSDKLAKLESVIKKFTGGKGLKLKGKKGGRKCKFRIPYVNRTIKVPCK